MSRGCSRSCRASRPGRAPRWSRAWCSSGWVVAGEAGLYIEDLGSTNGTYVNGARITAPTAISLSDTLRIGKSMLKLEP